MLFVAFWLLIGVRFVCFNDGVVCRISMGACCVCGDWVDMVFGDCVCAMLYGLYHG